MATMLVILAPLTTSLLALGSIPAVLIILPGAFFGSLTPDIQKGKETAIYHSEIPGAWGKTFDHYILNARFLIESWHPSKHIFYLSYIRQSSSQIIL